MNHGRLRTLVGATSCALAVLFSAPLPAHAVSVFGLTTDNRIIQFDSSTPGTVISTATISGLGGTDLVGIDFRPANRQLYGVGANGTLFQISGFTGPSATATSLGVVALSGTSFGVDFNPVPDRLRVTSTADQNLRINVDTAVTLVDGSLAFSVGTNDPNEGANPNVVGSAYTNSFAGALTTTLYNIDSNLDILVRQAPPNAGTLNTVGALGVDTGDLVGFDIRGFGLAFASLTAPGGGLSSLYSINLSSGAATLVGATTEELRGIALEPIPEPSTVALLGLGLGILAVRRFRR